MAEVRSSLDTALRLAKVFGTTSEFWLTSTGGAEDNATDYILGLASASVQLLLRIRREAEW